MKNLLFILAFMLMGTFTFASNNVEEASVVSNETIELIDSSVKLTDTSVSYNFMESTDPVGCLLEITFEFEDGTSETVYLLVMGVSCEELLR